MMTRLPFYFFILLGTLFGSCSGDDDSSETVKNANEGVPAIAWSSQINGLWGLDVEIDHNGKLIVVGDYTGNPQIDGFQPVTQGLRNGLLIEYDHSGQVLNTMDLGFQVFHDLNYMDFLPNGNPVVSGKAIDFQDVMYLTLEPEANKQVAYQSISGSGNDKPAGVAVDTDGNIIVGGVFNGTVRLLNGDVFLGSILGSAAIVKFSPAGEVLWSFPSPIPTASSLRGVEVDNSGNVYCYECAADMIYLRKLSADGELLYTKENLGICGYGMAVVKDSEIYINTASDVLRLDGDANVEWTFTTTMQLFDLAVGDGEIVVAGNNFSGGQFGSIEGIVRTEHFLGSLSSGGKANWFSTETTATRVSVNASGQVAFANPTTGVVGVLE